MRLGIVLCAALLFAGCVIGDFGSGDRYQSDFHYSFDLNPDGEVSVENMNGSVEIDGWDQPKVDISGSKFGSTERLRDDVKIDIGNTPGSLRIRTERPSSTFGGSGARYMIRIPKGARVERIVTTNGSIRVRDVSAAASLRSSNGSIRVENAAGDLEARTSNGAIELQAVRGSVSLKTSNGRIRAENLEGICEAETSNNSISIRMAHAPPGPTRLSTSNGSIDLALAEPPKSGIRMVTRNGSLTLHLPAGTSAHVDADTSNSSITSDFDVSARDRGDNGAKHLEGDIGGGGPALDLRTSNGHIRIVKGIGGD